MHIFRKKCITLHKIKFVVPNKDFNDILLWIALFFALFDSARNFTYLPFWFGYFKDAAVLLLVFLNLNKIKLYRDIGNSFYLMWFFFLFLSFQGFINYEAYTRVLIEMVKTQEFFFLIVIFRNWERLFSLDFQKVIKWYVYTGCTLLIFVNWIGYFIPNPIVSVQIGQYSHMYHGRISVGQPPIAIYPVITAFIFLLTYGGVSLNNSMKGFMQYKQLTTIQSFSAVYYLFFYLIAIFLAVSNTGVVTVILIVMLYLFMEIFVFKEIKNFFLFIVFAVTLIFSISHIVQSSFGQNFFQYGMSLYQDKIMTEVSKVFNKDQKRDPGMLARERQRERVFIEMSRNPLHQLIGRGAQAMEGGVDGMLIENEYAYTYSRFGILGCFLMFFFFSSSLKKMLKNIFRYKDKIAMLGCFIIISYLLHMYTLPVTKTYTIEFAFSLFYVYTLRNLSSRKNHRLNNGKI